MFAKIPLGGRNPYQLIDYQILYLEHSFDDKLESDPYLNTAIDTGVTVVKVHNMPTSRSTMNRYTMGQEVEHSPEVADGSMAELLITQLQLAKVWKGNQASCP